MIIKSMSRKSKSFSQLYDYLTRDKSSFTFSRNTYSNTKQKKEFVNEFYKNARYIRDARGKVYMYHEVLSLEKNDLSHERQKEILLDMSDKYLSQRADYHLAFGVIHEAKNSLHVHLMISANEIEGERRVRLTKQKFSSIQKQLETYKNQKYKELTKSSLYQDKKDLSKEKQNEQELKNRGVKSIKEEIRQNLKDTFSKATSSTYVANHLKSFDYEMYERGDTKGITYKNKNYRLKTLGVEKEYKQLYKKLEQSQQRKLRRQRTREERNFSRDR